MQTFFHSPYWRNVTSVLQRAPQFLRDRTRLNVIAPTIAARLLSNRIDCIYRACDKADDMTQRRLRDMLAGLEIETILYGLLETLKEVVLIVGSSIGISAAIGGGIGSLAGGVGAVPGAIIGAAVGAQIGSWILAALGLKSLAEFFIDGLPDILRSYYQGFTKAWLAGHDPVSTPIQFRGEQSFEIRVAADRIADGHVAMVLLLLSAIVAYLTRGKSMQALAQEARAGRLGDKFANWMLQNEDKLRNHPKLQPQQSKLTGGAGSEMPAKKPTVRQKEEARDSQASLAKGMPLKKVRCFETNDLPRMKIPEFDRQLAGQERGLNEMTVEEYLKGRELFDAKKVARNPKVAIAARMDYERQLARDLSQQLESEGLTPKQVKAMATEMAAEKMKTLAALHNPDMKVAGKDIIGDFGDRNVNSRIGAQWNRKGRVADLDEAAARVSLTERASAKMNVKLERCK